MIDTVSMLIVIQKKQMHLPFLECFFFFLVFFGVIISRVLNHEFSEVFALFSQVVNLAVQFSLGFSPFVQKREIKKKASTKPGRVNSWLFLALTFAFLLMISVQRSNFRAQHTSFQVGPCSQLLYGTMKIPLIVLSNLLKSDYNLTRPQKNKLITT